MVSQHEIRCNILTGGAGAEGGKLGIQKDSQLKGRKNPGIA